MGAERMVTGSDWQFGTGLLSIVALIADPVSNEISIVNYQRRLGHNSVSSFGKLVISNQQFTINNANEKLEAHFIRSG